MADNNKKSNPIKAGSMKAWIYTLVAAALIFFVFLDVFILVVIGMAPTMGALVIDRSSRRYFTMTVAFPNGVGVLPSAIKLFSGGSGGVDAALELVGDPIVLVTMYAAGAVGWVIYYSVPPFVSVWLSMQSEVRAATIKKRQKDLIKNWGNEVRIEAEKLLPADVNVSQLLGEIDGKDDSDSNNEKT